MITAEEAKNEKLIKALKLFAKNYQNLERTHNFSKKQNDRAETDQTKEKDLFERLNRKREGISKTDKDMKFIKASTFQKEGKKVPKGPKEDLVNKTIEI